MLEVYKGYGIFRQGLLCEFYETAREAKRMLKIYHKVYQDLDATVNEIEILKGKEVKI